MLIHIHLRFKIVFRIKLVQKKCKERSSIMQQQTEVTRTEYSMAVCFNLWFLLLVCPFSIKWFHLSIHCTMKDGNGTSTTDTMNSGIKATVTLVSMSYMHLKKLTTYISGQAN